MHGLTDQEDLLLTFLKTNITSVGFSYDEMMAGSYIKSKSSVSRLLLSLKEKGHIDYLPKRARSVRVLGAKDMYARGRNDELKANMELLEKSPDCLTAALVLRKKMINRRLADEVAK